MNNLFTLLLVMPVVVMILGIIFTKRKPRLSHTISQHIGSNKVITVLFGVACVLAAGLLLWGTGLLLAFYTAYLTTKSVEANLIGPLYYSAILALAMLVFGICLVGIGMFPRLPDEKRLASRIHQRIVQIQFFTMTIICAMSMVGTASWLGVLISIAAFVTNLVFGVLYLKRREMLKPYILIWESVCIILFLVVVANMLAVKPL